MCLIPLLLVHVADTAEREVREETGIISGDASL